MAKENSTIVVGWPQVQCLFNEKGFRENSALCSSDRHYRKYGDSAYAVRRNWYKNLPVDILEKTNDGILSQRGPSFDDAVEDDGIFTV